MYVGNNNRRRDMLLGGIKRRRTNTSSFNRFSGDKKSRKEICFSESDQLRSDPLGTDLSCSWYLYILLGASVFSFFGFG